MLGLFLASLGLATAVAGAAFLTADGVAEGCATRTSRTLRYWTLFMTLVGIVGVPLTLLQLAGPVPLVVAVASAAVLSPALGSFLRDTSSDIGLSQLAGREGRVLLPVGASGGKVVVQTMADRVELPARSDDGRFIARGCTVLVTFVDNGVAKVVPLDPFS